MTIKRRKTARPTARGKRRLRPAAPKVARARSSDAGEVTSKPTLLGYTRVSTVDQNLALQRDALTEAGCTKIFTEQMSGAVTDRPALHDALEFARRGDTLIVWKLDRLARSMKQLIETVETLRFGGIGFRSLTEALDTTTATPDIGVTQIAHRLGVSPATLYRYIRAARTANTRAFDNGRSTPQRPGVLKRFQPGDGRRRRAVFGRF